MTAPPEYFTAEQTQAAIDAAVQNALASHSEGAQGTVSADAVQAMINAALAQQAEAHNQAMQTLAASMRGTVQTFVPEHAGGPGTEIRETWSQAEQTAAWKAANEAA